MKFDIGAVFENLLQDLKFHLNMRRITGILHEFRYTFMIIFRTFLLRMSDISDKVVDRIKTSILFSVMLVFENRAVY